MGAFPEKSRAAPGPLPITSLCRTLSLTDPLTLCWDVEDNEVSGKHQCCVLIASEEPWFSAGHAQTNRGAFVLSHGETCRTDDHRPVSRTRCKNVE
ncbi:hypothetical protein QQF64_032827 [Cirrhinus molitorella]|uniref:Uncharacterized protein n=1 Tax=Cirrhinus molitorella TaxID=172907 RepID=A0ABR3MS58_9TELE